MMGQLLLHNHTAEDRKHYVLSFLSLLFSSSVEYETILNIERLVGWQDGYFMIRRGTNECGIEEDVVAGLPSTRNLITEHGHVDVSRDASV